MTSRPKPSSTKSAVANFNEICTVRIELRGTDPLIWREVEVPTSIMLDVLHDVIQIAMGWFNCHLWEFKIDKQQYGLPMEEDWGMEPRIDASEAHLRTVLRPRRTTINYVYDFGDYWEHKLTVSNIRQGEPGVGYPRYIAGEWNGPPEDCGSVQGFYDMLNVRADPTNPNYKEITDWLGGYDPKVIDEEQIQIGLDDIANPRNTTKTRLSKPKA